MADNIEKNLVLVGAGGMARSYFDVLVAQSVKFDVVCRSENTAIRFLRETGKDIRSGGIELALDGSCRYSHAIIATAAEDLSAVAEKVIDAGIPHVLVEKPGALYLGDLERLEARARAAKVNVYVAYNRRYYASVRKLRELARADGGIQSLHFDFTEWSDSIAPLTKGDGVKERWFLANSTHVVDLAFFLCGRPLQLSGTTQGGMPWHPAASRFAGMGVTEQDVTFTYRADWDAPGRWGLSIFTKNFKLDLCPLERLQITSRNSLDSYFELLDDDLDITFKPGLYRQVASFILNGAGEELCSLSEHCRNFRHYLAIGGYVA